MVGANPKFQTFDRAGRVISPGGSRCAPVRSRQRRAAPDRLRLLAILSTLLPLSFVLAQCGKAPGAGTLAANAKNQTQAQASTGDTFEDRFPAPQFKDRFPTPGESLLQRSPEDLRRRTAQATPRALPGGVAGPDRALSASGQRGSDHAGRPEILGLPLFRQQPAHRRAVPQHRQRRPPRPPRL